MTSETPNDDPLLKFIAFTQSENWEFDSYQIADILWLWQQQQGFDHKQEGDATGKSDTASDDSPDEKEKQKDDNQGDDDTGESSTASNDFPFILKNHKKEKLQTSKLEKLPISLPDTAFLRDTLQLGRFARPLIQKIDSANQQELDIKRTVANTANYSLGNSSLTIIPTHKPKKVRSLDVILLIEESPSMVFWKQMSIEIRDWLEQLGAFRDVKYYRIRADKKTKSKSKNKQDSANKKNNKTSEFEITIKPLGNDIQTISPNDLIDPRGERLILFFSDCTSSAWYSSAYHQVLQDWGTYQLVTLLSPFPEKLWNRTALNQGWRVQLQNDYPRRPTEQWTVKTIPELLEIKLEIEYEQQINPQNIDLNQYISQQIKSTYFILPTLSLNLDALAAWSQVVSGKSKATISGRLLEVSPSKTSVSNDKKKPIKNQDPETVIKRFANTSSPFAWELMKKLSAVPINLPIIRLIQQELLPHSTFADAVEVILSGLLKPNQTLNFTLNPNALEFEFKETIGDILLASYLRERRSIEVIRVLSDYVAKKLGLSTRTFEAELLTNPTQWKGTEYESLVRAFAMISANLFKKLGENYEEKTIQIEYSRQQLQPIIPPSLSDFPKDQNWLDFLQEIGQRIHLTTIESKTLITIFPNPQQSYSIIEVAKDLSSTRSAISSRLSRIYHKFETIKPNLFPSTLNKLKTLQQYLNKQYQNKDSPEISELETLESFETPVTVALIVFEEEEEETLEQWTFKTPTVNRHGQIIKTTTHTASYFTETLTDNVILEMVAIPGGTFIMGTDDAEIERLVKKFGWDGYRREKPQHNVTLSPFFMGKYPITQAQWKAIASRTDLKVNIDLDEDPSHFKGDNRPVEKVNWYEVVEFCQRLSKLTGRDYQLPSEAQWEYACRAVTEPLDLENGETYPPFYFGETITDKLANYRASETYAEETKGEYRRETTPVGQFPANPFGLYDMHGNVWEWCLDDWHNNYEDAPDDGRAWMEFEPSYLAKNKQNKSYSVLRGGSWYYDPDLCRSAYRNYFDRRGLHDLTYGFRVVCVFGRTL
ncbi:MAG: formylglycine-generating enzyme family protein [Crocosphaera sp.]|nr:formylglycine-generating enzyme family protein [Crocosphaera sp.]